MAIPDRPMNWQPTELTLDQAAFFQHWAQDMTMSPETIEQLKVLIAACSDWTEAEVGALKIRELTASLKGVAGGDTAEVPLTSKKTSPSGPEG